ncbi:cytochrome d ubiquinol oxidase subunit II [Motilibacter aurantiacus]|uniref:cytochrome d ubiquinol oxidase subunit II n=1 Tax=Motilibacter aurantiacus TaxID=2714955 RepID=UPI00140E07FC|nr:cytochrome d ubiquinol oxidase subunit II [Motilibacter aurantiacus]NHC46567.1 cytochrome d ubiquinol oxidase subunit II [Motilibacter aurantiacus]
MTLPDFWFLLIAVLWAGYFVLEAFDFGVGALLPFLAEDDVDRRVVVNTIGPVWDGNEVWLLTAGGATFAAFPDWYATLFSGFYLPLLAILVALIVRGVAFEYRGKVDSDRWRRGWDRCIFWGSVVPAFLWGVAFANIVRGVPLDRDHELTGSVLGLLNPYALLGGVTTLSVFVLHGAVFLALRTTDELRVRARRTARSTGAVAVPAAAAFLLWSLLQRGDAVAVVLAVVAAAALVAALAANEGGREGWAFTLTATTVLATTACLFVALFPAVMPSSGDPAGTLTVVNAASGAYTLTIMSWAAVLFTPVVLAYQGWTYWVFRKRVTRGAIPAPAGLVPAPRRGGSPRATAGRP